MDDPFNQQRREPAFEDSPEYLTLCARHGTTPIARPAGGGQGYVGLPGLDDIPGIPPLADLDGPAAAFAGYHGARTPPPTAELVDIEVEDEDDADDYIEGD